MADNLLNRVSYLQIPVHNVEEATDWYVAHLGFEVQWKRPDNKMTIVALSSGLELFLCEQESFQGPLNVVIGFESDDILKLLTRLKSKGVRIGEIRQDRGVVEYGDIQEVLGLDFDFYDPSGNMFVAHAKSAFA